MAIAISEAVRNSVINGTFDTAFDGGTGRINIYTGTPPATPATAATGTLLATLVIASDWIGAGASGVGTVGSITSDTSADASGTAGWFRFYNTDETAPGSAGTSADHRIDGTCGQGTGDLSFDNAVFVAGGTVAISSFTITMPAS